MTFSEQAALSIFLASYDEQATFNEIIMDIRKDAFKLCTVAQSLASVDNEDLDGLILETEQAIFEASIKG